MHCLCQASFRGQLERLLASVYRITDILVRGSEHMADEN